MKDYLIFSVSIAFISWMPGLIVHSLIKDKHYYRHLLNLNLIRNPAIYKFIGIPYFKWIVKNTFFKFYNPGLKIDYKTADLRALRDEMSKAEISHLVGFIFVLPFAIYMGITQSFAFMLTIILINVLMNLYPSLLQQQNKSRIDKLIKRTKVTSE
jgi:hypothetical protein